MFDEEKLIGTLRDFSCLCVGGGGGGGGKYSLNCKLYNNIRGRGMNAWGQVLCLCSICNCSCLVASAMVIASRDVSSQLVIIYRQLVEIVY